jgi:hypothetical protein
MCGHALADTGLASERASSRRCPDRPPGRAPHRHDRAVPRRPVLRGDLRRASGRRQRAGRAPRACPLVCVPAFVRSRWLLPALRHFPGRHRPVSPRGELADPPYVTADPPDMAINAGLRALGRSSRGGPARRICHPRSRQAPVDQRLAHTVKPGPACPGSPTARSAA